MKIELPEIVAVGIYDTQIAVKSGSVTKNRKNIMFEIELPLEEGGVSYIDSEEIPIRPNMLVCAKPGQMRHTRLPYRCYYVHMIIDGGRLLEHICATPSFIRISNPEKYRRLFLAMCTAFDSGQEEDEILLHSLVLQLIHTMLEDSARAAFSHGAKSSNREAIESTISFIHGNLTADLSLAALADRAGFSRIHFHKSFKSATGKTLRDFVEEQRIKKASNMLVSTGKTLTEIAYECGFSSQSYFSYAFKKRIGLTPREYAKKTISRYEATE